MRRFQLNRQNDQSGVSGVGVVAEGVQFSDGRCALRWLTAPSSFGIYSSIGDVETIHGHGGDTRVEWIDASGA